MSAAWRMRSWYLVHRWSSLVCTAFLLVLCISGLPLIFYDEIKSWTEPDNARDAMPANTGVASLDTIVESARSRYPGQAIRWIVFDTRRHAIVTMAPSLDAAPGLNHWIQFDAISGRVRKESGPAQSEQRGVMPWLLRLHTELFAGLAGELFLGAMGTLFVVAIVSGGVLYGPFMRKLDFGTVRTARSPRLRWLDLHNLLGIVTLAWAAVVGVTGVINELSTPLFALWRSTELRTMLAPYQGKPALPSSIPLQTVLDTARQTLPGTNIFSIVFPEPVFGSPYHYLVWAKGDSPLTSRLFTPVLIDAGSGALTAVAHLPWYLKALEVSRPLHFGDYGGLPLKFLWALLDLITIDVLASGLYLWRVRREASAGRF